MKLDDILQVSVISAFSLFILREIIDFTLRNCSKKRKLLAIKKLLKSECERNNFTFSSLSDLINVIAGACEQGYKFEVETDMSGYNFITIIRTDQINKKNPIPKTHREYLDKYLFDAAEIDSTLFNLMVNAQQAIIEIEHVRRGFLVYPVSDTDHLPGFLSWAKGQIPDLLEPIRELYLYICHEPLTSTKVR